METTKICLMLMICVCGLLALSQVTKAEGECEYNGNTYKNGKSFKEGGNCRKCKCRDGVISCKTKKSCKNVCKSVECVTLTCENTVSQEDLCCPLCAQDTGACDYNGLEYNDGDTFMSDDGCNTCRCRQGEVDCTEKKCKACRVDGEKYDSGTSFPSADGCNTCTCRNGDLQCSTNKCKPCKIRGVGTIPSGTVFPGYKDCDICACQNGDAVCRSIECPTCLYNGTEYEHEEVFRHRDGCNRCQCWYGEVECTDFDCLEDCVFNGTVVARSGESFPSIDGYNKCWCMDGEIECSDSNCTLPANSSCVVNGTVYQSGAIFLDEINGYCMCMYGEVECTMDYRCGNATEGIGSKLEDEVFAMPSAQGQKLCMCVSGYLKCKDELE